jgi:hypothetical protein
MKKLISYPTENKLRLHSKDESVNAVLKNNQFWFVRIFRSSLWELLNVTAGGSYIFDMALNS